VEHLQHFGLTQDPFQNEPDLRFYFDGASHRECHRRIERGLRQGKGLTVLTGEGGTGKTLLARRLFEGLEEEVFETHLMVILPGAADAEAVLARFARQLGVEAPGPDRAGVLAQIYEKLAIVREEGRHAVLILDDAHLLSREAMAEVGGLLNLEYEDRRLLSLFLVGLPELDGRLWGDSQLGQRIDVRTQLESFDRETAHAYLAHRLTVAGASPGILPGGALAAVYEFGHGRPRLMNTLADNALFEAHLAGRQEMQRGDVERAARDLGITPNPGETFDLGAASLGSPADAAAAPAGSFDLDAEMEAALSSSGSDAAEDSAEMVLDAPIGSGEAEATRMILPDDDDLGLGEEATRMLLPDEPAADALPDLGPPKDEADDVEDLFAELIED